MTSLRQKGISMPHNIQAKIARIRTYLNVIDSLKEECQSRFLDDLVYQGALLHYLYLVSDGVISLAQMILKSHDIPYAQSYYEAIDLLGEHQIIPRDFAYDFAKIASFRNFLAHDYERIDYQKICGDILKKMEEVSLFLTYIEKEV